MPALLKLALVAALLLPLGVAQAAESEDPIDAVLTKCLATPDGQTTAGMLGCLDTAYRAWDAELNTAYGALTATLAGKQVDLLKASQRKWLAYRDAERAFQAGLVTPDAGTLIHVTVSGALVDLVKARVLLLRGYVE